MRRQGAAGSVVWCGAAGLLLMSAGGCSTSGSAGGPDVRPRFEVVHAQAEAPGASGATGGGTDAAKATLSAARAAAPSAGETVYRAWLPDDARMMRVARAVHPGEPDVWVEQSYLRPAPGGDETLSSEDRQRLAGPDDPGGRGAVLLTQTTDHAEAVVTTFEPPLVVLPATLVEGTAVSQRLHMTVRPVASPSKVRAAGDATSEITFVGLDVVRTPEGERTAAHVRSVLRANLGMTKVRTETDQWYATAAAGPVASAGGATRGTGVKGLGELIAERRVERAVALGLPVRNSDEAWVAQDPAPKTESK